MCDRNICVTSWLLCHLHVLLWAIAVSERRWLVMDYSPKQRMLNAYRGVFSDRYPVAPEFWAYYPAKVLGVDMVEFEREVPFWEALQITFRKYDTEGWGCVSPGVGNPNVRGSATFKKISDGRYRLISKTLYQGREFVSTRIYDLREPSWTEKNPVENQADLEVYLDMVLSPNKTYDFTSINEAHRKVGEDYLLEVCIGVPFSDFIAGAFGFERAAEFFLSGNDALLEGYHRRYMDYAVELTKRVCEVTSYESFFIGCSYSCNSLMGPGIWRKWDKPFIRAVAEEVHRHGRLLHVHFHGRCMETVTDFAEIGIDCVCPFERPPGGDVEGMAGLQQVRAGLGDSVTFNGNVHTVETLIRGNEEDVRNEVRQIKQAFAGSPRLIIGTGDQVGRETPESNIMAMVSEAKKPQEFGSG